MNNQSVLAAAPDHIADASKMVAPAVQGEPVSLAASAQKPVGYVSQDFLDGKWSLDHIAKSDEGQISRTIPVFAKPPQPTEQQPAPDVAGLIICDECHAKCSEPYTGLFASHFPDEEPCIMCECSSLRRQLAEQQQPALSKYQPCGCVICTCEHETQCQGCGAKHCGTHLVGQIPGPFYMQPAERQAPADYSLTPVPDELFAAEFNAWWEQHGQFCRAGGGDYERTFAFEAWRHLYPLLMSLQKLVAEQQPAPDVAGLVEALESLVKGYVNLLEAGRDRITSLGGDCDPVPVMEQNDPWLRDARAALDAHRKGGEV